MFKVAVTGGIGSGKSSVCQLWQAQGVDIVDTDAIARQLVQPGMPLLRQLAEQFGQQILTPEGELDRQRLSALVMQSPKLLAQLNALMHPAIRQEATRQAKQAQSPYVVYDIPLLAESGWQADFDRVVAVQAEKKLRLQRAMQRDGRSAKAVLRIMRHQATDAQRNAISDYIVDNNSDFAALKAQVEKLHRKILQNCNETRHLEP